jgi:hypothetical protein
MITINLKELNNAVASLAKVGESLTAGKMKYRFAKVLKASRLEVEMLAEQLAKMAEEHGAKMLGGNGFEFDTTKQKDQAIKFNFAADKFMAQETVELNFDSKFFTFDELSKAEDPKNPISATLLADLLWLISDSETEAEEKPKAQSAHA